MTVDEGSVSSVFVPVAAVSADSRTVTKVFEAGMEFDRVVVGKGDDGIFGVFEGISGGISSFF